MVIEEGEEVEEKLNAEDALASGVDVVVEPLRPAFKGSEGPFQAVPQPEGYVSPFKPEAS